MSEKKLSVIIGAGAAGLATARRFKEQNFPFVVFERSDQIGGTWVYDERTDFDKYGLPIHTSMYKNLRTNLPKEIMGFPGFPLKDNLNRSYLPAKDILNFLQNFAKHFDLIPQIKVIQGIIYFNCKKFRSLVELVRRKGDRWELTVRNVETNELTLYEFDYVIVCNGHYHTPYIPKIPGAEFFKGTKLHAHSFRTPDIFKGKRLLIIGAGPSGLDIAFDASKTAQQVFLSHHLGDNLSTFYPENVSLKPDVKLFKENAVIFKDDSEESIDFILYCTGYLYNFPFLHENCGITVEENKVWPLYKHLICIKNPSLCILGLPFYVCANSMFDLQARFFLATINGTFKLPSEEDMFADLKRDEDMRAGLGFHPNRHAHKMGPLQGEYYDELSNAAGIEKLPPVFTKLHDESNRKFLLGIEAFRNDRFCIVNDFEYKYL